MIKRSIFYLKEKDNKFYCWMLDFINKIGCVLQQQQVIVRKMSTSMIYAKLKHFFPNEIDSIDLSRAKQNFIDDSQALSFLISSTMPHLSIDKIHNICRRQQKNVMQKIMQIKKIDLYQQIANVCPSQKDLRTMPAEQVAIRINHYTAKMALEQSLKQSSNSQVNENSQDQMISEQSQSIVNQKDMMEIDEIHYQNHYQPKGLRNIFEEEYNAYMPWNQMCIYDLN